MKTKFGAQEVILFGSLARRGSFTLYSDIDLAMRGVDHLKFYAAAAHSMAWIYIFKLIWRNWKPVRLLR